MFLHNGPECLNYDFTDTSNIVTVNEPSDLVYILICTSFTVLPTIEFIYKKIAHRIDNVRGSICELNGCGLVSLGMC